MKLDPIRLSAIAIVIAVFAATAGCSTAPGEVATGMPQAPSTTPDGQSTAIESTDVAPTTPPERLSMEANDSSPTERLRVVDGNLVDADGARAVLRGATLYAFPFYLADGWVDWPVMVESRRVVEHLEAILDRMAEFDLDTIRVPLGTEAWSKHVYSLTSSEWLDRLERIVDEAADRDINVLITWWDSAIWASEWPDRYEESFPFMRRVHERVGSRPNVMFEPMNEPRGIGWDAWEDATSETVRFFREDLGYDGILVLDTIDWSWAFEPERADALMALDAELLGEESNVAFAIHRYANNEECFCGAEMDEWERTVGRYVGEYPILVTEVGNVNEGLGPHPQWVDEFVTHLVEHDVDQGLDGIIAFLWRWQDENTMTDWDGVQLTPFGRQMLDLLEPLP